MADDLTTLIEAWKAQWNGRVPPDPDAFLEAFAGRLTPECVAAFRSAAQALVDDNGQASTVKRVYVEEQSPPAPSHQESIPAEFPVACRFVPRDRHAHGSMGEVWIARDVTLPRDVALKVLTNHRADDDARRRFEREARVTATLQHPGVVPVHACGETEAGTPFYVMPFISGHTLERAAQELHASPNPITLHRLLRAFALAANTLAYAHEQGFVHRDVKPENILLGDYGEVFVADWGLAKCVRDVEVLEPAQLVSEDPGATQEGTIMGSPSFMSPEQARDAVNVAPASDIYSLGATLCFLLTGKPPNEGNSAHDVLLRLWSGVPTDLSARWEPIPPALAAICRKALDWDPEQRYHTATELADDVQRWMSGDPVAAWKEPRMDSFGRWLGSRWSMLAPALIALPTAILGLVIATQIYLWSQKLGLVVLSLFFAASGLLAFVAGRLAANDRRRRQEKLFGWRLYSGDHARIPLRQQIVTGRKTGGRPWCPLVRGVACPWGARSYNPPPFRQESLSLVVPRVGPRDPTPLECRIVTCKPLSTHLAQQRRME